MRYRDGVNDKKKRVRIVSRDTAHEIFGCEIRKLNIVQQIDIRVKGIAREVLGRANQPADRFPYLPIVKAGADHQRSGSCGKLLHMEGPRLLLGR